MTGQVILPISYQLRVSGLSLKASFANVTPPHYPNLRWSFVSVGRNLDLRSFKILLIGYHMTFRRSSRGRATLWNTNYTCKCWFSFSYYQKGCVILVDNYFLEERSDYLCKLYNCIFVKCFHILALAIYSALITANGSMRICRCSVKTHF